MYNQQHSPCMNCMQKMNMGHNYMPMMPMLDMDEMCDHHLEMMYPEIYHKISPMVKYQCDDMEHKYGAMCEISKEYLESVCEEICSKLEKDHDYKDDEDDKDHDHKKHDDHDCKDKDHKDHDCNRSDVDEFESRQYGRRRLLKDLVGVIFLNELLGRRRRRRRPRPRPRPHHYGGYGY